MNQADQAQYASSVTRLSENELQDVLRAAEPPVCLLGGWAVHLHVTDGFRSAHGRDYIGSRDIDIGIHVDPAWTAEDITESSVAETLSRIESDLGYSRGRFGFYQQFHRETGDSLTEEHARGLAAHNVFRVDIDIIPDTTELDAFDAAFGFQPPAEPLLEPIFTEGTGDSLGDIAHWDVPDEITIAPPAALAVMKIRAFPDRDKSHKRLKDLADLHALLWYVADYDTLKSTVQQQRTDDDVTAFTSAVNDQLYDRTARLIDVDSTIVRQSIEQLFV